jgi:hypothetical protein
MNFPCLYDSHHDNLKGFTAVRVTQKWIQSHIAHSGWLPCFMSQMDYV